MSPSKVATIVWLVSLRPISSAAMSEVPTSPAEIDATRRGSDVRARSWETITPSRRARAAPSTPGSRFRVPRTSLIRCRVADGTARRDGASGILYITNARPHRLFPVSPANRTPRGPIRRAGRPAPRVSHRTRPSPDSKVDSVDLDRISRARSMRDELRLRVDPTGHPPDSEEFFDPPRHPLEGALHGHDVDVLASSQDEDRLRSIVDNDDPALLQVQHDGVDPVLQLRSRGLRRP